MTDFPYLLERRAGLPFVVLEALGSDFSSDEKSVTDSIALLDAAAENILLQLGKILESSGPSPLRTKVYNARKAFFQKRKLTELTEFPALALDYQRYTDCVSGYETAIANYHHAWQHAVVEGYRKIQDAAQLPQLQRALLFSSLDLLNQIPEFVKTEPTTFTKKERHIAASLLKYITRMATNTAPLSRLATIGLTRTDQRKNPSYPEEIFGVATDQETVKITPNVTLLDGMYGILLQQPVFYRSLKMVLNPMVSGLETEHYSWWHFDGEKEAVQETAAKGAVQFIAEYFLENQRIVPFSALVKTLAEATSSPLEKAEDYILELNATGFLSWKMPEYGLSPSWCGSLYQYLGFLENGSHEPVITNTAFLLNWLRTAARTLPHQPLDEAQTTLRDTADQVRTYFEQYAGFVPPVPVEQIFYEDVSHSTGDIPDEAQMQEWTALLKNVWKQAKAQPYSGLKARMAACLETGESDPGHLHKNLADQPVPALSHPVPVSRTGFPIGFLFQKTVDNRLILNGIYGGGGKMTGRWMHLFPESVKTATQQFLGQFPDLYHLGWYQRFNANFHPKLAGQHLALPEGESPEKGLLTGNLRYHLDTNGALELIDCQNNTQVWICDPGLEEAQSRPVFIQTLLAAGLPRVGISFLQEYQWQNLHPHLDFCPEKVIEDVIVQRALWRFDPAFWEPFLGLSGFAFFSKVRETFKKGGIPDGLMVTDGSSQPQFVLMNSPLHVGLLEKVIKAVEKNLYFEQFYGAEGTTVREFGIETIAFL